MDYSRTGLKGKTALVTGASRNIGRAIALAYAAEGADLVLNTRANRDELESVAGECRKAGARVVSVLADVGPEDIADACVFLASDASAYVTGDTIRVMGGRVIG